MSFQNVFRRVARGAVVLFGLLSSASAQSAGSSSLNDPIFAFMGNGGYDAQDYDISLRIFGTHQTVDGATTMQAVATQDLSSFNLDFGSMTVTSVIVNGSMARFSQADPELTVTPRKAIRKGESMKVSLTYSGHPASSAVNTSQFGGANFWTASPTQLTVLSEPSAMFAWSPVNDHPSDKATFSLHLTAPKTEQAVSNGELISRVENTDGTATTNYRINTPTATYFVVIAVGDYQLEEQGKIGNVRVRHYFSPRTSGTLRSAALETPKIIGFFQGLIGAYPFSEVGVLTVNNQFSFALETQSLVTLPVSFGRGESFAVNTEIVAHELAHQWFGAQVSFKTHADMWLHEGFAEYFSWLYSDFRFANQGGSLNDRVKDEYASVAPGSAVADMNKPQFLERLRGDRYGSAVLVGSKLERALQLIFEGTLPETYHDQVVAQFPAGATIKQLADVFATWNISRVRIGAPARLELIPLTGKPALDVPSSYGILTPPGKLVPGDDIFNGGVYIRGALTLQALRLKLGDENFFALLRAYLEKYKFSNASLADFVQLTLARGGTDAKTLIEHWLFDAQIPDLPELGLFAKDFKLGVDFSG
jgi:aminopeptidase N